MSLTNSSDLETDGSLEEDSVFLPLADLFTLLSLVIIYVVLTLGPTAPTWLKEQVVSATLQGSGPGKPIDPVAVYIALEKQGDSVWFQVTRNGAATGTLVPIAGDDTNVPEEWIKSAIGRGTAPSAIYVYMLKSEHSVIVKALFTDTQRFLIAEYPEVRAAYE